MLHSVPQSIDGSPPFRIPSSQLAGEQIFLGVSASRSSTQILLSQSRSVRHSWLVPQGPHTGPPQSSSVSLPFCTPSSQRAETQAKSRQEPLWQSSLPRHCLPVTHLSHSPPQSRSVSLPFAT